MIAYADNNNNDDHKIKNHSKIKDISDQVVSSGVGVDKDQVQQLLQLMQTQIAQTSGQDKATNAIKQIKSALELNPNGPLAQSLLYLSKQQAAGNFNSINEVSVQVATHIANGNEDIGQIIRQAASHTQQVLSSQAPSSSSSSSQAPTGNDQASIIPQKDSGDTIKAEDHSQHVRLGPGSSGITATNSVANSQIQTTGEPNLSSSPLSMSSSSSLQVTSPQQSQSLSLSQPPSSPSPTSQVTGNSPPIADAGHSRPDQTVNAGSVVTLDGSASRDPDGDTLTYQWTQTNPEPELRVALAPKVPDNSIVTFTAPSAQSNDVELSFKLTVTDTAGLSDSDTVSIKVKNTATTPPPPPPPSPPPPPTTTPPPPPPPPTNHSPIADAGHSADKIVNAGSVVTLDGSASRDPDGNTLTYQWTQTNPEPELRVALAPKVPDNSIVTFTAPSNLEQDATLNFQLKVTDPGGLSSTDTVSILVKHGATTPPPPPPPPTETAPIAVVGPDQTVNESSTVALDGSKSHDPDGDTLTFQWNQTSGPTVQLSNSNVTSPTFTAPSNLEQDATLFFKLTVTDKAGLSDSMVQKITVKHSTTGTGTETEQIYTPMPGGRVFTKEDTSGGNCKSDGIRFNFANDHTLVDRESTWVFTLNNDPKTCTDKPWWSPKIGSHGSTGQASGLYEASVPYDGGFKSMRTEGPHPQYHSCSGYQHAEVPPMPNGKPIGIKTASWRIPNGVHVEFWYDFTGGGKGPWKKYASLDDTLPGHCNGGSINGPIGINGELIGPAKAQDTMRMNGGSATFISGSIVELAPNQSPKGSIDSSASSSSLRSLSNNGDTFVSQAIGKESVFNKGLNAGEKDAKEIASSSASTAGQKTMEAPSTMTSDDVDCESPDNLSGQDSIDYCKGYEQGFAEQNNMMAEK